MGKRNVHVPKKPPSQDTIAYQSAVGARAAPSLTRVWCARGACLEEKESPRPCPPVMSPSLYVRAQVGTAEPDRASGENSSWFSSVLVVELAAG